MVDARFGSHIRTLEGCISRLRARRYSSMLLAVIFVSLESAGGCVSNVSLVDDASRVDRVDLQHSVRSKLSGSYRSLL